MKLKYYKEDDILVIKFSKRPIAHAEESNWAIVHFDRDDQPVRIEILDASRFLKEQSKVLPRDIKKAYFSSP